MVNLDFPDTVQQVEQQREVAVASVVGLRLVTIVGRRRVKAVAVVAGIQVSVVIDGSAEQASSVADTVTAAVAVEMESLELGSLVNVLLQPLVRQPSTIGMQEKLVVAADEMVNFAVVGRESSVAAGRAIVVDSDMVSLD